MSKSLFEKAIKDYASIGGGPISLTPLVGEALLDKHLIDRLEFMKKEPLISKVSMTTNAVMAHRFDDEQLGYILQMLNRINISVYGLDREEYLTMTKKDEYELFREQVIRIAKLAPEKSVTVGVRHLKARDMGEISSWRDAIELESGRSIEIASSTGEFANWSHFDTSKPLPFNGKWMHDRVNDTQCGIPLLAFQVMSDGRVSFCACANFDGTPDLMIGDITIESLSDIFSKKSVVDLWDWNRCGVPDVCKNCSFHTPLSSVVVNTPWVLVTRRHI